MTRALLILVCLAAALPARPQTMSAGASGSSRAASLPASGRTQPGAVAAEQSAGAGTGVNTMNSSIQVSGDFAGSVPACKMPDGPIVLTLAHAVKLGLTANLGAISASDSVRAARAARIQELSALL